MSTSQSNTGFKIAGIVLALSSGAFIGSSYVFKKKGLLNSQKNANGDAVAGEGHRYLKEPLWWTGMTLMIIGEVCNFIAYGFVEAILVTPLGALSVVLTAILSAIFLKEHLTFFGKVGCALCIVGATIIVLQAPETKGVNTIDQFMHLFIAPGFLVYTISTILISLGIIFFVAPKYGKKYMLVYISVCSFIGGISVSCTQGLGAAIITSVRGDNQFTHWFMYFLMVFVVITLLMEINYLNKALELFNTAMVTPVYYVTFTTATIIASAILFQGFNGTPVQIFTVVLGFLVICAGIVLLQMSKAPPGTIPLDRHSSMLLDSSRVSVISSASAIDNNDIEPEALAIRGSLGLVGSIRYSRSTARARSTYRRADRQGRFSLASANARRVMSETGTIPQGDITEAEAIAALHRNKYDEIPMQEKVLDGLLDKHTDEHGLILEDEKQKSLRSPTIKFGETSTFLYPSIPGTTKRISHPPVLSPIKTDNHGYFAGLMSRLRHHGDPETTPLADNKEESLDLPRYDEHVINDKEKDALKSILISVPNTVRNTMPKVPEAVFEEKNKKEMTRTENQSLEQSQVQSQDLNPNQTQSQSQDDNKSILQNQKPEPAFLTATMEEKAPVRKPSWRKGDDEDMLSK